MILQRNTRCGFTLIEALISIVLVGIAIAALVGSNQSFTIVNGVGLELSTAEVLTEQIREQTIKTEFGKLADSETTYTSDYLGYSQKTKVEDVNDSLWPPVSQPTRRT